MYKINPTEVSPSEPLVTFPLPLPQLVNAGLGVAELGGPGDVSQAVLELVQLPQSSRPAVKDFHEKRSKYFLDLKYFPWSVNIN